MITIKKRLLGHLILGVLALCSSLTLAVTYQAENYSAAFDKTSGNIGNVYKTGDVDIEATADTGGGYNVGWIDPTEWLAYSNLTIPATGDYRINVRVASMTGGTLTVDLNGGSIKLGDISVPATGGWQKWVTVSKTVRINAGSYNLGVYAVTGGWNFNWIEVVGQDPCSTTTPYKGVATSLPGKLEAENYDEGCANVAYSDADAANQGGQYRQGAVDIETSSDTGGGYNLGWMAAGEWLKYTVNVTQSGSYTLSARVASNAAAGVLKARIDGVDLPGEFAIANTGGWQSWRNLSLPAVNLSAGLHTLSLHVISGSYNLNYLEVSGDGSGGPHYADRSRGEWALVVIPDTQHYSQNRANAPIAHMHKAFDWIVSIKDRLNIQFVQGLGDITESWNARWEWDNSSAAWYKLQGQLPHMPVQGNHDSPASLNEYFPVSSFSRESWWGGDYGGIENNYALLNIGREKYLFLQVQAHDQYSKPGPAALVWAKQILANNPDRKVILATHDLWATTIIKDNLLTKYDNIVFANAGHDCVREASYVTTGPNGGVSHNFVTDYQCDSQEVMLIRYYIFKPLEDKVDYFTYSPVTDKFEQDASSQGSFTLVQIDP